MDAMSDAAPQERATPEVQRLRLDAMLNAEVIRALRAARDSEDERAREEAALAAQFGAALHERVAALSTLEDSIGPDALGDLASMTGDLADYTRAKVGELVLQREQLNLRHWLSQLKHRLTDLIAGRGQGIRVHVDASVPVRIVADPARLLKVLSHLIGEAVDAAGVGIEEFVLEVSSNDAEVVVPIAATGLHCTSFVLHRGTLDHRDSSCGGDEACDPAPVSTRGEATAEKRLRAALVETLLKLMGASKAPHRPGAHRPLLSITVPLQESPDQAHTGTFRLAEAEATLAQCSGLKAAPQTARQAEPAAPAQDVDEVIDMLYLDRQLGSLSTIILARTAPAFLSKAVGRMTDLYVAHDLKDIGRLRGLAHAWKGSAMTVGARRFAVLLDAIENCTAAGRLPGAGQIVQLRDALDRVVRALERHCQRGGDERASL
jgi:hypothetical protein